MAKLVDKTSFFSHTRTASGGCCSSPAGFAHAAVRRRPKHPRFPEKARARARARTHTTHKQAGWGESRFHIGTPPPPRVKTVVQRTTTLPIFRTTVHHTGHTVEGGPPPLNYLTLRLFGFFKKKPRNPSHFQLTPSPPAHTLFSRT